MTDTPFWVVAIVTALIAVVVSAWCLPVTIFVYRLENRITTRALPRCVREERRDGFEMQLAAFMEAERRQMYRPEQSAVHLFVRLTVTFLPDVFEACAALLNVWIGRQVAVVCFWLAGYAAGTAAAFRRADRIVGVFEARSSLTYEDVGILLGKVGRWLVSRR